jgi:hypothetical protein
MVIMTKVRKIVIGSGCCEISVLTLCEVEMKIDFFAGDTPLLHFRARSTLSHSLMDLLV